MNCALEYDEKGVGRVFVFIDDSIEKKLKNKSLYKNLKFPTK